MKKFVLSVLLMPVLVLAQSMDKPVTVDKPVVCVNTEQLFAAMERSEYQETPHWMGTDSNSYWGMFVNLDTRTWTIIQFTADVACVVGAGENHGHMTPPNK